MNTVLHYRIKKKIPIWKTLILDFFEAVPFLGFFIKTLFSRYEVKPYNLYLNLDKVKTDMVLDSDNIYSVSQISFSKIKEVVFDYNKKYEGFGTFPNMAIFVSKDEGIFMKIPLSRYSDYVVLQKELSKVGIISKNNISRKALIIFIVSIILGILAVLYLGPYVLNYIFSIFLSNI